MMTSVIDTNNQRREFLDFLRNSDIFSISQRGVTTVTEEFNGDGNETQFTLANAGVKNVRSATVEGSPILFGSGYSVDYGDSSTVVTFAVAPVGGTDNVDIVYDYGTGDRIYPDFARPDIDVSTRPRMGFEIISTDTADAGWGNAMVSDIDIQIDIYTKSQADLNDFATTFRTALIEARDSFFYFGRMIPVNKGFPVPKADENNKNMKMVMLVRSIFNWEIQS